MWYPAREHFEVTVFVAPGQLRNIEFYLVGYDTNSWIQERNFDTAFMSVAGGDVDCGFMDFEEDELRIRQTLLKCARNKVVMADATKFGKPANMCTDPFDVVDRVAIDQKPVPEFSQRFKAAGMGVNHG